MVPFATSSIQDTRIVSRELTALKPPFWGMYHVRFKKMLGCLRFQGKVAAVNAARPTATKLVNTPEGQAKSIILEDARGVYAALDPFPGWIYKGRLSS